MDTNDYLSLAWNINTITTPKGFKGKTASLHKIFEVSLLNFGGVRTPWTPLGMTPLRMQKNQIQKLSVHWCSFCKNEILLSFFQYFTVIYFLNFCEVNQSNASLTKKEDREHQMHNGLNSYKNWQILH